MLNTSFMILQNDLTILSLKEIGSQEIIPVSRDRPGLYFIIIKMHSRKLQAPFYRCCPYYHYLGPRPLTSLKYIIEINQTTVASCFSLLFYSIIIKYIIYALQLVLNLLAFIFISIRSFLSYFIKMHHAHCSISSQPYLACH
jgi:hypothetical protein